MSDWSRLESFAAEYACPWSCRVELELTDRFHSRFTRTGMRQRVDAYHLLVHEGLEPVQDGISVSNTRPAVRKVAPVHLPVFQDAMRQVRGSDA